MLMNRLRYIGMMLLFAVVTCTMLGSFSDRCEAYVLQEMQCPLDHDMEVTAPWGEDNHGSPPHVHKGIDFAATQGEPVRAVADGYITSAGWDDTAMYMVTIQHADGWRSVYMDMGGLAVSGGPVSKGDIIGYVGHPAHICILKFVLTRIMNLFAHGPLSFMLLGSHRTV